MDSCLMVKCISYGREGHACLVLHYWRDSENEEKQTNKQNETLNLVTMESFGSEMKRETSEGRISLVHMRK